MSSIRLVAGYVKCVQNEEDWGVFVGWGEG